MNDDFSIDIDMKDLVIDIDMDDLMIDVDIEDLLDFSGLEELKKSLEPPSHLLASLVVDDD
ncbi:hypothetical protein Q5O14_01940 [Eubacteriaceae bacterium ES2]|nr:hypothetical protein Q5O14_01940 [Eubacteriaceae bacterium ES2]